jgi:hypothetical protein
LIAISAPTIKPLFNKERWIGVRTIKASIQEDQRDSGDGEALLGLQEVRGL